MEKGKRGSFGKSVGLSTGLGGTNALKLFLISDNISHLQGEILTIVDACTEGDKNKAMKDLIKDKFNSKLDWICQLAYKRELASDKAQPEQEWEHGLVPYVDNENYRFEY